MSCPSGYSQLDSYPRMPKVPVLPWDTDGSPCREAYNGEDEAAWYAFLESASGCHTVDGKNGAVCVLTSCLIEKYRAYLARVQSNETAYFGCSNA